MMKTRFLFLLSLTPFLSSFAFAHCPLCTGAIGLAVMSASYMGLDASIVGVFAGALAISSGLWMAKKIKKQYIKYQTVFVVLASFALTVLPLAALKAGTIYLPLLLFGEAGSILNRVYTLNSLIFGGVIGAITSTASFGAHNLVKAKRGKVFFPYQSIVFALVSLIIVSAVLQVVLLSRAV